AAGTPTPRPAATSSAHPNDTLLVSFCRGLPYKTTQEGSGRQHPVREGVAVEGGGVLAAHGAALGDGDVAPCGVDDGLGVGPGGVAVGVVDLHHDVLDADGVAGVDGGRVIDGAEPEAPA